MCKFLEQLGQPVAFDNILRFLLDDMASDFQFKHHYTILKKLNFIFFHFHIILKKFPFDIISYKINKYPTIDFFIWYQKLLPKFMPVVYILVVAASENHMHGSLRVAPLAPKICTVGFATC